MAKLPVVEVCDIINTSPDDDILQSSNDLSAIKREKEKNKAAKIKKKKKKNYHR